MKIYQTYEYDLLLEIIVVVVYVVFTEYTRASETGLHEEGTEKKNKPPQHKPINPVSFRSKSSFCLNGKLIPTYGHSLPNSRITAIPLR